MTDIERHPCARGLTSDCFRKYPQWAKQALATRLLHALTPKALTKRLPPSVNKAFIVPGISLPPGVGVGDFPAGAIITYGTVFPPGWTVGDPLPPGAVAPPATAPETPGVSVVPPFYLGPGAPIYPRANPPPAGVVVWFSEPFDDLTTNSWTDNSMLGGSAACVAGVLHLEGGGSDGQGYIQRTEATAYPENWSMVAAINYVSGSDNIRMECRTGTYRARLILTPPDTVGVLGRYTVDPVNVGNYMGSEVVWRMTCTGTTGTVYMDDVPVIEDFVLFLSGSGAGQTRLHCYGPGSSLWDYFNLTTP